ncbi:MAG: hypothetical protein JST30_10555 [Armatimonadetes bacterium]|nr:hypothetical protein [Armatimonadota bacterium]
MLKRRSVLGLAFGLTVVLAVAGCSPSTKVLRLNLKKGDTWSYDYKVDTWIDPSKVDPNDKAMREYAPGKGSAVIEGVVSMNVVDVKDGKTTIRKYTTFDKVTGSGIWKQQAEVETKGKKPETHTIVWDSRMVDQVKRPEELDPMTNTLNGFLPEKAIGVGSSWEYYPYPGGKIPAKANVEAEEKIRGFDTYKIAVVLPASMEEEKVTLTVWIEKTTARPISVELIAHSNQRGCITENKYTQVIKE